MRFRGTLAKDALGVLLDVAQALARLSAAGASCVVTVSPESMTLALKGSGEELQSFARLQLSRLFLDVLVESLADNHIAFSCDVRHLHQALSSGKDASAVMLRLLRRGDRSLLCLRTRAVDIDITQSIPVTVLAMAAAEQFQEPNVPAPQIVIEMPPLKTLRSIVDRLKAVHKSITMEASKRGTLALRIDTHPLTLQTLFAHLRFRDDLVDEEEDEDGESDEEEDESMGDSEATNRSRKRRREGRQDRTSSSVTVEAKVLGKAILMDNGSVDSVLCCISENRALVLHAILLDGFGSFTCYLPVLAPEE